MPPAMRDQAAQLRIAGTVGRQQNQAWPVAQVDLAADDQVQTQFTRPLVCTHHARQGAFVGDRQRPVAHGMCTFDQLLGVRGTAQKGEIAQAVQFGVVISNGASATFTGAGRLQVRRLFLLGRRGHRDPQRTLSFYTSKTIALAISAYCLCRRQNAHSTDILISANSAPLCALCVTFTIEG